MLLKGHAVSVNLHSAQQEKLSAERRKSRSKTRGKRQQSHPIATRLQPNPSILPSSRRRSALGTHPLSRVQNDERPASYLGAAAGQRLVRGKKSQAIKSQASKC